MIFCYCAYVLLLFVTYLSERILDRSTIEPIDGFSPEELVRQKCNRRMYCIYCRTIPYCIDSDTQSQVTFPWLMYVSYCTAYVPSMTSYLNSAGMQNDIMQNHGDYTGLDTGVTAIDTVICLAMYK